MKICALLIIVFACASAHSTQFDIEITHGENISFAINQVLTCGPQDRDICQAVCGSNDRCVRPEPLCRSCAGAQMPLLRVLFTALDSFFEASKNEGADINSVERADDNFSVWIFAMAQNRVMIFTPDSVYNFFRSSSTLSQTAELWQHYCPAGFTSPRLLSMLDDRQRPTAPLAVLCRNPSNGDDLLIALKNLKQETKTKMAESAEETLK